MFHRVNIFPAILSRVFYLKKVSKKFNKCLKSYYICPKVIKMKKSQIEKLNEIAEKLAEGYFMDNDYKCSAFMTFYKKEGKLFADFWHVDYEKIAFENAPEGTIFKLDTCEFEKCYFYDLLSTPESVITSKLNLYFSKK